MSIDLAWGDIAIRLFCTAVAGFFVGLDRGEHGRPAGVRTTLLVSLAACLAMIMSNTLLATAGKAPDSFVSLDVMRLPLGVLSGMGFIGAGVIVRRDTGVLGVTTAATLWFMTVLGLCFGGGQIALGFISLLFAMLVIAGLRPLELRVKQDRQGSLTVVTTENGPTTDEIQTRLAAQGYGVTRCAIVCEAAGQQKSTCEVTWRARRHDTSIPDVVRVLANRPGVISVAWTPLGG
jgi:putative Mg2+ transporter-C (MgtC) family protein